MNKWNTLSPVSRFSSVPSHWDLDTETEKYRGLPRWNKGRQLISVVNGISMMQNTTKIWWKLKRKWWHNLQCKYWLSKIILEKDMLSPHLKQLHVVNKPRGIPTKWNQAELGHLGRWNFNKISLLPYIRESIANHFLNCWQNNMALEIISFQNHPFLLHVYVSPNFYSSKEEKNMSSKSGDGHSGTYLEGKFWRNKAPGRPGQKLFMLASLVPCAEPGTEQTTDVCCINKWLIIISHDPRVSEQGGSLKNHPISQ